MLLSFQLRQRTDDTVPMNDVFFIHHCRHACFSCCSALSVYSSASKLCYSCIKLKYFLWITWYGVSYVFTYMHTMYFPCKPLLSICCIDFSLPPNTTFSQDRLKLLISFSGILSLSLSLSLSLTHSLTVCLSVSPGKGQNAQGRNVLEAKRPGYWRNVRNSVAWCAYKYVMRALYWSGVVVLLLIQPMSKCVRLHFNVAMIAQTVVEPPPPSGQPITRNHLTCRIQYSANGKLANVISVSSKCRYTLVFNKTCSYIIVITSIVDDTPAESE